MIRYCLEKWDKNKDKLKEFLGKDEHLKECNYEYLIKLVVEIILNDEDIINEYGKKDKMWDSEKITIIARHDRYEGTMLFLIPRKKREPFQTDYLMGWANYGTCTICDTLIYIQESGAYEDELPTESQLLDYMMLCKDLLCSIIRPYNKGIYYEEIFDEVTI